jgi:hypothetical protein
VKPVSERTLYQRINRYLKSEFMALRKSRSESATRDLGNYYLVDTFRNAIIDLHVDLAAYSKELSFPSLKAKVGAAEVSER